MSGEKPHTKNETWAMENGVHDAFAEGYNDRHYPDREVREDAYKDNPLQRQAYEKGVEDAEFDEDRIAY